MEVYLESIKTAIFIFPFLAFLITIPYLLFEYHKYGSVPFIRSSIVYTFILYLLVAYFLVILPLPSQEMVIHMTPKDPQLIPFSFVNDFINTINESRGFNFLRDPIIYTVLFNIILTVPFGIYLRYYFKKKWYIVTIYTFFLSLFFELTQLTGLYGIYPKAYRLFDVDDLIVNTLGGILGFIITPLVTIFLPNRDKIDAISYKKGKTVSFYRRSLAFLIDNFILFVLLFLTILLTNSDTFMISLIIIITIYYLILPTITKYTLGKYLVKIKLFSQNKHVHLSIFIRQFILYFLIVFGPIITFHYKEYINDLIILFYIIFLSYNYFEIFLKIFGRKKGLLYERITKTENISTIVYQENESSQDNKNVIKCNKEEDKDEDRS